MRSTEPPVWGVAGKYCAGKDALVTLLKERGFGEINFDRIGHRILTREAVKDQVLQRFGSRVLDGQGRVDRRALGKLVFRNRRALRDLERILHPPMIAQVEAELARCTGPVAINAAILFRVGLQRLCRLVICVQAPFLIRLRRARQRDGLPMLQALNRILAQGRICPKFPPRGVDIYYVENKRDLRHLRDQALALLRQQGMEQQS